MTLQRQLFDIFCGIGGVLSSLSSNQWCHQGYLETSYSWAISLLHGHCAILHRFQLLYHVMTPSFPGLNCCIQWCHFLTLPDCSSCFNICIYLLSHKIHLTDDYQKSHYVSILWKHQGPSVLVVILLWQVYWWKYFDIWFCLSHSSIHSPATYGILYSNLHMFCNCIYFREMKPCLCILFWLFCFSKSACDI